MQTFSPNLAMLPLSPGRGVQAQASTAKDAFRDVFRSRLMARLSSRSSGLSQPTGKVSPGTKPSLAISTVSPEQGQTWARGALRNLNPVAGQPAVEPEESGSPVRWWKSLGGGSGLKTQKQAGAEAAFLALGPGEGAAAASPVNRLGESTSASPSIPLLLKEFMAFLETLPDKTMTVLPEQVQDLAAFLLSAGLPQEEVERLLFTPTSQEKGLSLADVQAAWQRVQESVPLQSSPKVANQPAPESTLPPEVQEFLESQEYQRHWERLTLPQSMVPMARLALARLGASPQDLAQLDEEATGQDIPLSRVLQILQNCPKPASVPTAGENVQLTQGEALPQPNLLGERPVTGEEVEEWRQVLLKAGVQPEVVEKLLGRVSPASQEELKATLLALAPPEKPPPALSDPKPLYLPESLRLKPLFSQAQANGEQSQEGGDGAGWEGHAASGENSGLTTSLTAGEFGEAQGLPSFAADLQAAAPNRVGSGGPLTYATPSWQVLTPEARESLWSQLQSGIITNLGQGETKINVSLNPPELGQIQLTLHLTGQELAVTAVASRPEVAELANLGVKQLIQTLAQQGIALTQFQVHPRGLPGRQDALVAMGSRNRGNEPGPRLTNPSRRRTGEVDRFV